MLRLEDSVIYQDVISKGMKKRCREGYRSYNYGPDSKETESVFGKEKLTPERNVIYSIKLK